MIHLVLNLAVMVLRVASFALLVYCVMSFLAPGNDLFRKVAGYVEPLLQPIRLKLFRWFPSLRGLPVDLSPLAVWLLIDVAMALINLLRRVF